LWVNNKVTELQISEDAMKRITTIIMALTLAFTAVQAGQIDANRVETSKKTYGVGFGIPYGVLGSNVDFTVARNLSLSMGFGTTILAGMGYSFGAKYFLAGEASSFRPKVSAFYGTNAIVTEESMYGITTEGQKYSGLTFGLGAQWMWGQSKKNGIDFDIMYIASSGAFSKDDVDWDGYGSYDSSEGSDPGRIKISIGYRRGF